MTQPLRLATRGSQLARTQSQHVADAITASTGRSVELVIVRTRGDTITDRPLSQVGGKGLFTKEIEDALLQGAADLAVHSMKDMPTDPPGGLVFGAVPSRVDPRDVLVGATLNDLPAGAVVGTGSARRLAQLRHLRPDLDIRGIRGNVDTRVRKVREGEYQAIVLAAAGLDRLGRRADIAQALSPEQMLPAVGQGALAVQARADDTETLELLRAIHDPETGVCVQAERAFLAAVAGGCSVPAACHAVRVPEGLWVRGMFAHDRDLRQSEQRGPVDRAVSLGRAVAAAVK